METTNMNRLSTNEYKKYINNQKRKTSDPVKQKKWLNEEWQIKIDGFKNIFQEYLDVLDKDGKCVCLASRTGQEVVALKDLGFNDSIGIDIVPFEPYTIEGDFHNLPFEDNSVSFIYTNCVDHVKHPDIWSKEIDRVLKKGGHLLLNLLVGDLHMHDEYSVFVIKEPLEELLQPYFGGYLCIKNEFIPKNIHAMDWEILMRKQ